MCVCVFIYTSLLFRQITVGTPKREVALGDIDTDSEIISKYILKYGRKDVNFNHTRTGTSNVHFLTQ
jgi:hypothetical protein